MRPTCTACALKHISQASILLSESRQGYPNHRFYSLGHLAEAADELALGYPKYAALVRTERKKMEVDPDYTPDFEDLLVLVDEECSICQLEPDLPPRGTGRITGTAKAPAGALDRLSEAEREVRHNPIAWTKCELKYPEVRRLITKCVGQVEGKPGVISPYAVCRAAIKCPPG